MTHGSCIHAQALMMMGTQLIPISEDWAEQAVRAWYVTAETVLTLNGLAAVDGVLVALHTAEHGDGRAARTDGDVQAAKHDAQQAPEQALRRRVEAARVLDVLTALLRRRRRATRAGAGGDGGDSTDEGESGDEDLGEHGCVRSREGRGCRKWLLWELESEERFDGRLDLLYNSSMHASHFFGDQSMTMDDEDEWLRSKHRQRPFIE
jgi:hypothetical protein